MAGGGQRKNASLVRTETVAGLKANSPVVKEMCLDEKKTRRGVTKKRVIKRGFDEMEPQGVKLLDHQIWDVKKKN